jgi:hypothetical protein
VYRSCISGNIADSVCHLAGGVRHIAWLPPSADRIAEDRILSNPLRYHETRIIYAASLHRTGDSNHSGIPDVERSLTRKCICD